MVMPGAPDQGSEIADRLQHWTLFRSDFGPAGQPLTTSAAGRPPLTDPIDFELGVIAGSRSIDSVGSFMLPGPNDGRVTVERTKVAGMSDHIVVTTPHHWLTNSPAAIAQIIVFLRTGRFHPAGARAMPKPSI